MKRPYFKKDANKSGNVPGIEVETFYSTFAEKSICAMYIDGDQYIDRTEYKDAPYTIDILMGKVELEELITILQSALEKLVAEEG